MVMCAKFDYLLFKMNLYPPFEKKNTRGTGRDGLGRDGMRRDGLGRVEAGRVERGE